MLAGLFFRPIVKSQYQEIMQIVRSLFYAWAAHTAIIWMMILLARESLTVISLWIQCLQFLMLSISVAYFSFASPKNWIWFYYSKLPVVLMLLTMWLAQGFVCVWLLNW